MDGIVFVCCFFEGSFTSKGGACTNNMYHQHVEFPPAGFVDYKSFPKR